MQERLGALIGSTWRHVGVALIYGVGLILFRQIIIPHYVLLSGVRVAVLALVPYRYWPALLIGEELSLIPLSVRCWTELGPVWSLLNLVPATAFSASVIYAARQRWGLAEKNYIHIGSLLACSLAVSFLCTAYNLLMVSNARLPAGYPALHYDQLAAEWWLGNFLGILTVAPAVLAFYQVVMTYGWRGVLRRITENRDVFESCCLALPTLMLLLWVGFTLPHARSVAQVCLFLPVVWLALRHGWRGAAFGGVAASLAVVVLMPEKFDHNTMQAEVVVAFTISTMLLAGARIGLLNQRAEKERADMQMALELARSNLHMGEMQMRATSLALEQIREMVRSGYTMMLGRLRHLQPAVDDGGYQRVALLAQDQLYRLADSLHPVTWRERGLPAALREGSVARMLDEAGIQYSCDLRGQLSCLSTALHLVIYRTVCEGITEGCSRQDICAIKVRIRSGESDGRRWVAIRMIFRRQLAGLTYVKWSELLPRLMRLSCGLGLKALKDRAATFGGAVREYEQSNERSIICLMFDS